MRPTRSSQDASSRRCHTVCVLAWNQHATTERCLQRVRDSGYAGPLTLVDNGSTLSMDYLARRFACSFSRHQENRFVNPVWNDLFDSTTTRYLTLLNNDCLVPDRYLGNAPDYMHELGAACMLPSYIYVDDILDHSARQLPSPEVWRQWDKAVFFPNGYCTSIDLDVYRTLDYRIPESFKLWFGDDWIMGQILLHHRLIVHLQNLKVLVERSRTINSQPWLSSMIEDEKACALKSPSMLLMAFLRGSASLIELVRDLPERGEDIVSSEQDPARRAVLDRAYLAWLLRLEKLARSTGDRAMMRRCRLKLVKNFGRARAL